MSEKVVALPGFSVPTPKGQPVASVVDILKEFLALAEAGQLTAIAVAAVMEDGTSSPIIHSDFSAAAGRAWPLYAGLGRLNRRFGAWLDE
jgi:hypothetical protein